MPANIYRSKLVFIGECTVGKTALLQMIISDGREYPKTYNMTFGTDLQAKRFSMGTDDIEILIYDSSGSDLYTHSLSQFWDQPNLLMIVYDVTSKYTFDAVSEWHKVALAAEWAPISRSPLASLLFANKCDLSSHRIVSEQDGRLLAEKLNMEYFEGSAKENQGIVEAFQWFTQICHENNEKTSTETNVKPSYDLYHKSILRSGSSNNSSPVLI
uniref:Uncharacterized protein n=2 Tax=Clastoptera arizonana TaxID=38151 RepID=A0A1B6EBD8_9HEMI